VNVLIYHPTKDHRTVSEDKRVRRMEGTTEAGKQQMPKVPPKRKGCERVDEGCQCKDQSRDLSGSSDADSSQGKTDVKFFLIMRPSRG
jgi:hypothetical protein